MSDNKNNLINDLEDSIKKSLRNLGYLFPSTEDEVETFEKTNKIERVPEEFSSASELVTKSKHIELSKTLKINVDNYSTNLARAARKGNSIPEDVLKKMKEDRDRTEDDEK